MRGLVTRLFLLSFASCQAFTIAISSARIKVQEISCIALILLNNAFKKMFENYSLLMSMVFLILYEWKIKILISFSFLNQEHVEVFYLWDDRWSYRTQQLHAAFAAAAELHRAEFSIQQRTKNYYFPLFLS